MCRHERCHPAHDPRLGLKPATFNLKIISGGQTGVDRAALDFARQCGLQHGGWCPRARWAEDGVVPPEYDLTETPDADPAQRTEWNVRDSDATVVFSVTDKLTGGSKLAIQFAAQYGRPCLHLWALRDDCTALSALRDFLQHVRPRTLNIAGPRASEEPDAAGFAVEVLTVVFGAKSPAR